MARSALLGPMALIEGGAGLFLLLKPGLARHQLLGEALPFVSDAGLRVAGLCLLGLGMICLLGWLRPGLRHPFAVLLAYNTLGAAGLAGVGILGGQAGPLLWPAVILHAGLVVLQVRMMQSG